VFSAASNHNLCLDCPTRSVYTSSDVSKAKSPEQCHSSSARVHYSCWLKNVPPVPTLCLRKRAWDRPTLTTARSGGGFTPQIVPFLCLYIRRRGSRKLLKRFGVPGGNDFEHWSRATGSGRAFVCYMFGDPGGWAVALPFPRGITPTGAGPGLQAAAFVCFHNFFDLFALFADASGFALMKLS